MNSCNLYVAIRILRSSVAMEIFTLYFLFFLIALFVPLYVIFFRKNSNGPSSDRLPPGTNGWPILGENMELAMSGPEKFISDRMKKYSRKVFRTSLLGERMAVLCGVEGHKFIFTNEHNFLGTWLPLSLSKILALQEYVGSAGKGFSSKSQILKKFLHEILRSDALRQFVPVMDSLAKAQVETEWRNLSGFSRSLEVFPSTKKFTFTLTCRFFLGIEDPEQVKRLMDLFTQTESGLLSLPIDLPGTTYNRACKAGDAMVGMLVEVIRERRKKLMENKEEIGGAGDLLSRMLIAVKKNDGEFISELNMCSFFKGLLVATCSMSTTAITFVLKYLAELPHVYQKVYQEQIEVEKSKGPEDGLTRNDLQRMGYTWNVVCETLRLMPPNTLGGFREVVTEFEYAGFTIPKGWKILWSPHSSHRDSKHFPNPEEFNPSRFEGMGPERFTYVPFGEGPGICPGREFVKLYILVFLHRVVTSFRLEKSVADEGLSYHISPFPTNGLPLRLIPH